MRRVGSIAAGIIALVGVGVALLLPNGCHFPHGNYDITLGPPCLPDHRIGVRLSIAAAGVFAGGLVLLATMRLWRTLVWIVLAIMVVVTAGSIYIARVAPLEATSLGTGSNAPAGPVGTPTDPITMRYASNGLVYVAVGVRNTSLLPVRVERVTCDPADAAPYIACWVRFGNGMDADPRDATLPARTLGHGGSIGLLIEYFPQRHCGWLPRVPQRGAYSVYTGVALHLRVLGQPRVQWLPFPTDAFRVQTPTQAQCKGA